MRADSSEYLDTDLTEWEIGPFHGSLPAPMKLRLSLDGELIVGCEIERGYLHREIEKTMERLSWDAGIAMADRVDPESSASSELAFVAAVEGLASLEISDRTAWIRTLVLEMNRVSSHLGFFSRMARSAGAETMSQYVLRDRERLLDLFELMTGSRYLYRFFRFGGLNSEVSDGVLERVLTFCRELKLRIKEYNDLFSYNRIFLKRTQGVGLLDRREAMNFGLTGPNLRSTGAGFDLRVDQPYLKYQNLDLESIVQVSGDCHARYLQRLYEVDQSLNMIRLIVDQVPLGGASFEPLAKVPKGENYAMIESPRGLVGCHVVSSGGAEPVRVAFRTGSTAALSAIPGVLVGYRIEDLSVILASFDISMAEVDR